MDIKQLIEETLYALANNHSLTEVSSKIKIIVRLLGNEDLQAWYNCEFVTKVGLPFEIEGAVCFKNQAQFHPLKYLSRLCKCINTRGGNIYTNTAVFDVK